MAPQEQIWKGIGDHLRWKRLLQEAAETGQSETTPAAAGLAGECAFGQWLDKLDEPLRSSPRVQSVRACHEELHRCASEVLELALGGEKSAARDALAYAGEFATGLDRFTAELMGLCCAFKSEQGCTDESWVASCTHVRGVVRACCSSNFLPPGH